MQHVSRPFLTFNLSLRLKTIYIETKDGYVRTQDTRTFVKMFCNVRTGGDEVRTGGDEFDSLTGSVAVMIRRKILKREHQKISTSVDW